MTTYAPRQTTRRERPYSVPVRAPLRAAVMRVLARRMADLVGVRIELPDGRILGTGDSGAPGMRILSWAFFDRVGTDLKIGVGEGFMAREWEPAAGTDLADLLTPFAARLPELVPPALGRFRRLIEPRIPGQQLGDRTGARANIAHHYDLSNEVFALFLDETLSYSAAWFPENEGEVADHTGVGVDELDDSGLADAQRRKVDAILDLAGVGSGTHLLEIGSGWGQLAIQAGQRDAHVETITLSIEQAWLARQRIETAGLEERVRIELRDYRDVTETYDAVASVEMIEAVGHDFWPDYFATLARVTRPGGAIALQAITMPHERMLASKHAYGWIHKYVFPGGLIPSVRAIEEQAADAGLAVTFRRSLGADYATTLRMWRARFLAAREEVLALGFDESFLAVWEFYLAYSEAGFRSGHLDVWQLRLEHVEG